jgi:hypothetical protein
MTEQWPWRGVDEGARRRGVVACLCVLAITSCGGLTDAYTSTQHLQIPAITPGATWSETDTTTFEYSVPAGKTVHLLSVSLTSSTGEFSWLASVSASAPSGQPLASMSSMESTQGAVAMSIEFDGDLVPLMLSPNSLEIYWNVQFAPTLAQSYPDGATLTVTYSIQSD